MTERLDALTARKGKDGKTYYTKIGAAFPLESGGYAVRLDALPLPDGEGSTTILLKAPRERDERVAPPRQAARRDPQRPLDDDVPF